MHTAHRDDRKRYNQNECNSTTYILFRDYSFYERFSKYYSLCVVLSRKRSEKTGAIREKKEGKTTGNLILMLFSISILKPVLIQSFWGLIWQEFQFYFFKHLNDFDEKNPSWNFVQFLWNQQANIIWHAVTYNSIHCRLEEANFAVLMVRLDGEIGQQIIQLTAAGDLISGWTVDIMVFVAAVLFQYASAIITVQFPITWRVPLQIQELQMNYL